MDDFTRFANDKIEKLEAEKQSAKERIVKIDREIDIIKNVLKEYSSNRTESKRELRFRKGEIDQIVTEIMDRHDNVPLTAAQIADVYIAEHQDLDGERKKIRSSFSSYLSDRYMKGMVARKGSPGKFAYYFDVEQKEENSNLVGHMDMKNSILDNDFVVNKKFLSGD